MMFRLDDFSISDILTMKELLNQFKIIEKMPGELQAKYGEKLLIELSKQLTKSLSKEYSRSNLQNMRALYLTYPKRQTVSGELSGSHYCELISIEDSHNRAYHQISIL
jgi:hypothetical protein